VLSQQHLLFGGKSSNPVQSASADFCTVKIVLQNPIQHLAASGDGAEGPLSVVAYLVIVTGSKTIWEANPR